MNKNVIKQKKLFRGIETGIIQPEKVAQNCLAKRRIFFLRKWESGTFASKIKRGNWIFDKDVWRRYKIEDF